MIGLYVYSILWLLSLGINIIFTLAAISASILTGIHLNNKKIHMAINALISFGVFFGVAHLGFLLGLATVHITNKELDIIESQLITNKI